MTPAQYASAYRKLRVYLNASNDNSDFLYTPMALEERGRTPPSRLFRERQEIVDVNSYLLVPAGKGPAKPYYGKFGQALNKALYIEAKIARVDGTIETRSFQYADIAYSLVTPFWGKGYPEECQLALQLWDRLRLGPPDIGKMVQEKGSIGLDCNGFVGGFLERSRNPGDWVRKKGDATSVPIGELAKSNGVFLNALTDFAPPENNLMLMVRADPASGVVPDFNSNPVGHVTITEPGTAARQPDDTVTVTVSEATSVVGITTSVYTILSVAKATAAGAVFRVQRGCKKGMAEEFEFFKVRRLT